MKKKIKIRYIFLAAILLFWLFCIFIPRLQTEIAIKKYVKEYYGTEDVRVEHNFAYGSYGFMNGNDNIRYRDGMIMDYQRGEYNKEFTEMYGDILSDMPGIIYLHEYIDVRFSLDDVYTPYHILEIDIYNTNDISSEESKSTAISSVMEIVKKLSTKYNIAGLKYSYSDQHACYKASIKISTELITNEMLEKAVHIKENHEHNTWFYKRVEEVKKLREIFGYM